MSFSVMYQKSIVLKNLQFACRRRSCGTYWLSVRSVEAGPESWWRRSLWTMPMSFIHALFLPPWPPIPLCHIVMSADHHQESPPLKTLLVIVTSSHNTPLSKKHCRKMIRVAFLYLPTLITLQSLCTAM